MLSQLYVVLPLSLINVLAFTSFSCFSAKADFFALPLSMYIFIWINDTAAYLSGVTLGKHKLFPRISPKKSWEGSIGGGVLALVAAYILSIYHPMLSTMEWMGMAIVVVVTGTWGDLIESCMKREMGIKDSGNILPGHGGILDRFDSAMLAIPSVAVYLYFLEAFNVL